MHIKNLIFQLALCMSLVAPVAKAQEFTAPDRAQRQGMSYEEYRELREKMRMRMEKRHENQRQPDDANRGAEQAEREKSGSTYGQGFDTRRQREDRPDASPDRRPDHPRFERFNRGDRARP
jgi:hypothetical protein